MTNSNGTDNKKIVTTSKKVETNMEVTVKSKKENKQRKLKVTYQQDILELFGYIYHNVPQRHTYYSLAQEMSKNVRTIKRMIDDLNDVCPCVTATIDEITKCAYFSIDDNFTEKILDKNFGNINNAPLLYVFLKSFLIRKMSLKEIMNDVVILTKKETCKNPEKLQRAKKKIAGEIIMGIFDSTSLIDYDDEDGELIIGNVKFLSYDYNRNFLI